MTIKAFARTINLRADVAWADENPNMNDMPPGSTHYKVTLRRKGGRQLTVPYSMGPAHHAEPEAVDVLDCLISDASSADHDFEQWCRDLGFDTDSRKAERIYRAVVSQTAKLRQFLGDDFDTAEQAERL